MLPLLRRSLPLVLALTAVGPATGDPRPVRQDDPASPPTVAEMQSRINGAIDAGVDYLLLQQNRDGSWTSHTPGYRNGMTALAALTLVKCGLPKSHPAIENALRYLRRRDPAHTYTAGVLLMLLRALDDPANEAWAERVFEELVEWESAQLRGSYGYPEAAPDLSNTQYAVLGLWAATDMGFDVPLDLWRRLVERTATTHLGAVEDQPWPEGEERRTGRRRSAGFVYREDHGGAGATGSMTTAGLCVMLLAERCAGRRLGGKVVKVLQDAKQQAITWLDVYWAADKNPNSGGNHLYYLYGVERVGSLLGTEFLGPHEWYRDGAEVLLRGQRGEGDWSGEVDTCFALLFLVRATAPSSGAGVTRKAQAWGVQEGEVHVRVTGDMELSAWITGFDARTLELYAEQDVEPGGLRVTAVEYLLEDQVVARVEGDPLQVFEQQRFPARFLAPRPGKQRMRVRVHVVAWGAEPGPSADTEVIESATFDVEPRRDPEAFQRAALGAYGEDLLIGVPVRVSASSHDGDGGAPERAVDGMQATRWVCAARDPEPRLRLDLDRPLRAGRVVLSPLQARIPDETALDRVLRVRVVVNGKDTYEADMPDGPFDPLGVDLPKAIPIRSLEVLVLERTSDRAEGRVGWSEVTLEPGR